MVDMSKFIFLPMKEEKIHKISKFFYPVGKKLSKPFSSLKLDLKRAGIEYSLEEFLSMVFFSAIFSFFIFFIPVTLIGSIERTIYEVLPISLIGGTMFSLVSFMFSISSVKIAVSRKRKLLEKDLFFAIKYIYIKVKSGISLYDAMVGVAHGDFGEVSKEFKKTIKDISGGIDEIKAMENMGLRSTSDYFRKVIWQITNNLRSGANITDILDSISESLMQEHRLLVKKYGAELNPTILMYMMFTVVIPSLAITVILVMSAFSGIEIPIYLFYTIPIFLFILQIFFISIIKNKRPLMVIT